MIAHALALVLALQEGPLSAEETRAFMKKLAAYVEEHHLKKDPDSPQKGMIYEYFDTTRQGRPDRWVQGEALDTMHDGAWFMAALAAAALATNDPAYEEFLVRWPLPFYLKMLNHSDTLFSPDRDDSAGKNRFGREHLLQKGEKGFVPYFWDDGASVSLEAERKKSGRPHYPALDLLAGQPNPEMRLSGYSLGSSNHMAQDLGVMLQTAWLLLREKDPRLSAEIAEAAKNLQECRARHGAPGIPACLAPAGLAGRDSRMLQRIGEPRGYPASNHYTRCLAPRDPAKPESTPGFADDQEYHYYAGIARAGGRLPKALAFQLVYDAYTQPHLIRYWSDSSPVPPGMNRFDLGAVNFKGGKPDPYRSDRELPMGSRFGPQNMIVCGWALQALREFPGLWEERIRSSFASDLRVRIDEGEASEPVTLGAATLRLLGRRSALEVSGSSKGDRLSVRLHADPEGKGTWAEVTLRADGTIAAVNDAGGTLRVSGTVRPDGDGLAFEFVLPYTVAKGQQPWANGIEHARYAVSVGDARRAYVLASTEEQVVGGLRRELGEGLRTWSRIFAEKGFIPTGIGRWDAWSDAGGYAHLLKAGAQWLHVLEGRRDWEVLRVPKAE